MNDLLGDWKTIAITLLGVLVTLLTWLGKGALERLKHLEDNAATNADVVVRHHENQGRFDRVDENFDRLETKFDTGIGGVHDRIDRIFDRLPGK